MKKHIHFFNNVMIDLNHYGWTIDFCGDSYCWKTDKRINIDINYKGDIRQIILHEIAHIDTAKYCNQKHNSDFWKRLEFLTKKYLKSDLDEVQKNHKSYSTKGFYSLKYKN